MSMRRLPVLALFCLVLCGAGELVAAVPGTVHYQGLMADADGWPVSGSFRMEFRLFGEAAGGDAFWWEVHDVVVQDGLFDVVLGKDLPLVPADLDRDQTFLEIEVLWPLPKPQQPPPSKPMAPRLRVLSNPYSLFAGEAESCGFAQDCETVGGQSAEIFVTQEDFAASGVLTQDELESYLSDGGYCQGMCYSDELVQAFLEAGGYEACTCYGDADVQAYLDEQGYTTGAGYSDADVQAYLDEQGYTTGAGYTDADVKAYLDGHGYQTGAGYTDQDVQAYLDAGGYVAGPGYSDNDAKAFLDAAGYNPCACYGDVQVKAFLDATGYKTCACYGDVDVQAYLAEHSFVPGPHYTNGDVKAFLDQQGYLPGPYYSDADVQALLDQGGYEPGPGYNDNDVQGFLDANDYHSGPHLTVDECLDAVADAGYMKEGGKISAANLPPDGLDEVSNKVLTTTFKASFASPSTPIDVPDLWPPGIEDAIVLPDMGQIVDITVSMDLGTDSPADVKITLTSPEGAVFVLHDHGQGVGNGVKTTYDAQTQPVEGDMGTLDGTQAVGSWKLKVVDDSWSGGGVGAKLNSWGIEVEALDDDRLAVNGDLEVSGKLTLETGGGIQSHTNMPLVPSGMIAMFQGSCPEGWSEVTELRNRFPRGWDGSGPLVTGGADTAPHSHSIGTACGPGDCIDWAGGYSGSFGAPGGTSQSAPPIIPPYLEVVYCKKN